MSRKPLVITASQIQTSRSHWYAYHFDQHKLFNALPLDDQRTYQAINTSLTPPQMTIFGGLAHDWPPVQTFQMAARYHLNVELLNCWYLSDEGWQAFQELWTSLPEPVGELYTEACVQLAELYPLSTDEPVKIPTKNH